MIRFTTTVLKFDEQGEKTGWWYLHIPADIAHRLLPGVRKSFRVKGSLDAHPISRVSLIPAGGGDFILAFNAAMRKGTRKGEGATIAVAIEVDKAGIQMPPDFTAWLAEDDAANTFFGTLPESHRNYWINWLNGVKTPEARESRLARAVAALARGFGFAEMLRAEKAARH